MIKAQISSRGIKNINVLKAMEIVPRDKFVPKKLAPLAWSDQPLPIGFSQTISQPYVVAFMTEMLELDSNSRILEIGTGSGYQTAVLSKIGKEIFSIEIIKKLSDRAKKTFTELGYNNIHLKVYNGRYGWEEFAPFSHIIVTAASQDTPKNLLNQLKADGKMIIPLGKKPFSQNLTLITKYKKNITKRKILPVRFVPLVQK